MFAVWKLNHGISKMKRKANAELRRFDSESPGFHDEVLKRMIPLGKEFLKVQDLIEMRYSQKLCDEARRLGVEIPDHIDDDQGMWRRVETTPEGGDMALTPKGRSRLRKLIDAEKARCFEVKTLWLMKFWFLLLASLVGIIGALTGLFAVLQHKK
jgi:hypothetical protein